MNYLDIIGEQGFHAFMPDEGLLYKYVTINTAKLILSDLMLKFSLASEFNDPYDLHNQMVDFSSNENGFKDWLYSQNSIDENVKNKIYRDFETDPKNILNKFTPVIEQFKNQMGICCFSKLCDNILMWSHYAENHKGVCLGFDLSPINSDFLMMHVNYRSEFISKNYFKEGEFSLFNWIFTKSNFWSYEEEIRVISQGNFGLIPFEKDCLKEVIFGSKTTKQDMESLINIITTGDYQLTKLASMEQDISGYRLIKKTI